LDAVIVDGHDVGERQGLNHEHDKPPDDQPDPADDDGRADL